MAAKEKNKISISAIVRSQYFIPVLAIVVLLIFDLISNPAFFLIDFKGQTLSGNLITVFSHGAQYVILTVGMTFVTAASGGQDISVGAIMTIAAGVISVLFFPYQTEQMFPWDISYWHFCLRSL